MIARVLIQTPIGRSWSMSKTGRIIFMVIVCCSVYLPGKLCNARSDVLDLTLDNCIDRALRENLDLKSYYLGLESRRLSIIQAQSGFDPSLSLTMRRNESVSTTFFDYYKVHSIKSQSSIANFSIGQNIVTGADWGFGYYSTLSESNIETEKNYTSYLGFQLNQPLLRRFGTKVNRSPVYLAQLQSQSAIHDLEDRAVMLVYDVVREYWNLVYARETLMVREISLAHADSLLAYNEKGLELGIMTESDVLEAKSARVMRQQEVMDQKNAIRESEDALRRILNMTSEEDWNLNLIPTDTPDMSHQDFDSEEALAKALSLRPDYKRAELAMKEYEMNAVLAKNALLPGLDLNANYRLNGSGKTYTKNIRDLGNTDEYGWMLGLVMSYPIRNRDARADYEKKQIDIRRASLTLENLRNGIISEIRSSIRNEQMSREKIDVAKISVELNELKLKAEEERFRNKLSSSYYVLEFQKDLADALNQYNRAIMDYALAVAEYRKACGTLLEDMNIRIMADVR